MSLDSFLVGGSKEKPQNKETQKEKVRTICYFSSSDMKVKWYFANQKKNLKILYTKKVKWREISSDLEFTTDLDLNKKNNSLEPILDQPISKISILKSNLQKAVRRQNLKSALQSAKELYRLDPLILVRRLSIISLEDVILLEDFPYLLFAMAVYPALKPDLDFLLRMVESLTLNPKRDYIPNFFKIDNMKLDHLLKVEKSSVLEESEISLLYSLCLRSSYGGLKCDVRMVLGYAQLWISRFLGESKEKWKKFLVSTTPKLSLELEKFNQNHLILEGVDFHTCPSMLKELLYHIKGLNSDKLKKIIWYCRSGINARGNKEEDFMKNKEKYWKIYLKIEAMINKYSEIKIKEVF